jgi:Ca2+/Na+ antiporter
MAAGASSPELLASFTTLFITHTSLGIGTIVGSEIFNQLMICAGSILAARNTQLHLSKSTVLREVFFYGLGLVFLLVALSDRREVNGVKQIYIQWYDGLLLFGGYIAYVLVCAYYESIVNSRFSCDIESVGNDDSIRPMSPVADLVSNAPSMDNVLPFLRQISNEPSTNFLQEYETEQELYTHMHDHQSVTSSEKEKQGKVMRLFKFLVAPTKPKPSTVHGLEDRIWNGDGSLSCFLWEQSLFYTKTRVHQKAWQLRWFTFRRDGITSVPNRTYSKNEVRYPDFSQIQVDEARFVLKMYKSDPQKRDCKYWCLLGWSIVKKE